MIEAQVPVSEELGDVERIALAYAPYKLRAKYRGLLLLDGQLARIALTAREPALAQLKLAWWRDACADLAAPRGHPVLQVLAQTWQGQGQGQGQGEMLVALIDAWEELAVGEGAFVTAADAVAEARANAFAAVAVTPASIECRTAARRWTLATLADQAADSTQRAAMLAAAGEMGPVHLPRDLRPLAVLDGLARRALRRGGGALLGDRLSPLAAIRLGIFGR